MDTNLFYGKMNAEGSALSENDKRPEVILGNLNLMNLISLKQSKIMVMILSIYNEKN